MVFRLLRPDSESVWKNEEILERYSKYRGIIDGTQPARYLIAKSIECEFTPQNSMEELEVLLREKSIEFNELLDYDVDEIKQRIVAPKSYIHLAEHLANKYLEKCIFCERQCEVNRIDGAKGFCLLSKDSYVSSAFLHMGEESVLIPSGTIFFQGCNFGCVFCQNYDISQAWKGKRDLEEIAQKTSSKELAILNTDFSTENIVTIEDFDNNGKKDFLISGDDRVIALSTQKPWGLWLSPAFSFGLPLFIALVVILIAVFELILFWIL